MKINIELPDDYKPESCSKCQFIQRESKNFGRHFSWVCRLTKVGDSYCEGSLDQNLAEEEMRKKCPILKKFRKK